MNYAIILFIVFTTVSSKELVTYKVPMDNETNMEVTKANPGDRVIWRHETPLHSCLRFRDQAITEIITNCDHLNDTINQTLANCKQFVQEDGNVLWPLTDARINKDHSLIIEKAKETDTGMYMCILENPLNETDKYTSNWRLLAVTFPEEEHNATTIVDKVEDKKKKK